MTHPDHSEGREQGEVLETVREFAARQRAERKRFIEQGYEGFFSTVMALPESTRAQSEDDEGTSLNDITFVEAHDDERTWILTGLFGGSGDWRVGIHGVMDNEYQRQDMLSGRDFNQSANILCVNGSPDQVDYKVVRICVSRENGVADPAHRMFIEGPQRWVAEGSAIRSFNERKVEEFGALERMQLAVNLASLYAEGIVAQAAQPSETE